MSVARDDPERTSDALVSPAPPFGGAIRQAVALALAAAAGFHLAAFFGHLHGGATVATFFVAVAAMQLAAAAAVQRRLSNTAAMAITIGNAALIVLWAASRTIGVPGGTHAGAPEAVGLLDTLTVAAEGVAVVGLAMFGRDASSASGSARRGRPAVILTASFVAAATLVWPASHDHHGHRLPSMPVLGPVGAATPVTDAPPPQPSLERARVEPVEPGGSCEPSVACHDRHQHGGHTHPPGR